MEYAQEENTKTKEEYKISGDDIVNFIRKIFKASNSRNAVIKNEEGKKIFKINLILLTLLFFIFPMLGLIGIIILILTNFSISIEKK